MTTAEGVSLQNMVREFSGVPNADGSPFSIGQYPRYEAIERLLYLFKSTLNCSQYRLAKLLGCENETVRRWDKGICRPSPLYLSRMMFLLFLKEIAIDIASVHSIEWDDGNIHWLAHAQN